MLRLRAWTFIETIVVIAIILILSTGVAFVASKFIGDARVANAKSQVEILALAVQQFANDGNSLTNGQDVLSSLFINKSNSPKWNGPYISKEIQLDPWGNPYQLTVPGPNSLPFEITSLGADGKIGGAGDNQDISSAK